MDNKYVKNENITDFFLIKRLEEKESINKNKYLDIVFSNINTEINGKVWDISILDKDNPFKAGDIVRVNATVTEFNGAPQLKVNKISKATKKDRYKIEDIIDVISEDEIDDMFNILNDFIYSIKDLGIAETVNNIVIKNENCLKYYPAARSNHHSIRTGLLKHIVTMLKAAKGLAKVYSLDTDLLYAGIILHDMGKIDELIVNDVTGIAEEYTIEGNLLGHIISGIESIEKNASPNLTEDKKLLLKHMILAHHQYAEWGSPKRPMIKEGELLHYLDMIDARMYDFDKANKETEKGKISNNIYTLERRIYNNS